MYGFCSAMCKMFNCHHFDKAMQLLTKLLVISVGKSVWAKLDMVWWPGLVEELGEKQIVVSFFDEDAE